MTNIIKGFSIEKGDLNNLDCSNPLKRNMYDEQLQLHWINYELISANLIKYTSHRIRCENQPIYLYIIESGLFTYSESQKNSIGAKDIKRHDHLAAFILGYLFALTVFAQIDILDEDTKEIWNIRLLIPFIEWSQNRNNLRFQLSDNQIMIKEIKVLYERMIPDNLRSVMHSFDHDTSVFESIHNYINNNIVRNIQEGD